MFPVLSVYHRRSPERVLPLAEKFFKALVMLGWPITVGVFLLAPQFNSLLHLYAGSEPALQILALAIVFMFADNTFAATLNAIDKQNVFAFVAMVGLVINVGVNLVVIPRYGYLGASWAVVVTEAALVVVGWFVLRAQLGTIRLFGDSWKAVVAGVVMGAFIYVANPHHNRVLLFVVVVASALIYGAMLLLLRVADQRGAEPDPQRAAAASLAASAALGGDVGEQRHCGVAAVDRDDAAAGMGAGAAHVQAGHWRPRGEPPIPHLIGEALALEDVATREADRALDVRRRQHLPGNDAFDNVGSEAGDLGKCTRRQRPRGARPRSRRPACTARIRRKRSSHACPRVRPTGRTRSGNTARPNGVPAHRRGCVCMPPASRRDFER